MNTIEAPTVHIGMSPATEALCRQAADLINRLRASHLTFCAGLGKLEHLADALLYCRAKLSGGIYLEAGVAMGGSAMLMAILKPEGAPLKLYDVFGLLPPPGVRDGAKAQAVYAQFQSGDMDDPTSINYLAQAGDLLQSVKRNFAAFGINPASRGVAFIPGLFQDTLRVSEPVALAHIDCDWYDSVRYVIEQVKEHLLPGGLIVFDDYDSFEGCRVAVDEWLGQDGRYRVASHARTLMVQRIG